MTIRLIQAGVALALALAAQPALAEAPGCAGVDRIAKLKAEQPAKYAVFERDARAVPNGEGLLWRVTSQAGKVSYLFGTMHATEADLVALAEPVRAAIGEARTVAVEIADVGGAATQAETVAYVTRNGVDFSGKGLAGLTNEQAELVKRRLADAGMPAQVASMLKPWFLGLTLQLPPCQLKQVRANLPTVDATVERIGREEGDRVVSLETVAEQLEAASKVSDESALKMIRDAVAEPEAGDDLQATTLALYRARRVGWYFAMKGEAFGEALDVSAYADFLGQIVDRRNTLMLERAKPLVEEGGAFVAVGALHLPGGKGLVELFRKEGYTVEKVW